jgi:protein kinase-like protein/NACHT domain-containing protein
MDSTIATSLGPDDPRAIGQFTILGRLGRGGMGEVYLGFTEGGYAAVKRILPHLVSSERFQREVGVLYRVPLGVAPRVLAHDSTAARPWFATEYVPGLTAEEAVESHGPLRSGALWLLLAETAAQLRAVHAAGIVHRDLKPANVMLVRGGVKLIDFGIARAAGQERLTRAGESCGTPGFTAPEQRTGAADVAAPADVYSLGALILYAASGHWPGAGPDAGPGVGPGACPGVEPVRRVDAGLAALVEACLAADPGDRPTAAGLVESARDMVLALDPSWPPDVLARIESRGDFAATPVGKMETIPPPSPEPDAAHRDQVPRRPGPQAGRPWLHAAAEKLAEDVRSQWEQEERLRQVHDPYPLPVRFATAAADLFDHWPNVRGAGRGAASGPLELDGELDAITAVYKSIPSGRLVVLGSAGSGKTILALRFVLDWLRGYVPGDRIPVIFSLGSWDPAVMSLRDWMCRQLARDHNALEVTAPDGGNLASALVEQHWILPVLDGFDEIAPGLQGAAIAALNYYAGPLLLTSRPGEYATAVREKDVLTGAACVELRSLELEDIDDYLTRASRPGTDPAVRTVWEPVLARIRGEPDTRGPGAANVAAAFTAPLMIALARTIYSDDPGQDPRELLDTERFSTAEALREHLLARFVPAAYRLAPAETSSCVRRPRNWSHERAQRWLGYLAWHMEEQGQRDLSWWEVGTVMPLFSRMLVVGTIVGLACGLAGGLIYGIAAALASGPVSGLRTGVTDGVMDGLGVGLTFGLLHGLATILRVGGLIYDPSYMQMQLRGATFAKLRTSFLLRFGGGLVAGLLFGIVWATGSILYSAAFSGSFGPAPAPGEDLALGTGLGLAIGLISGIGTGLEVVSGQERAAHPLVLLKKNRVNAVVQVLLVGLVIGLGYGAALGPATGLSAGLMVAIGLTTMRCWGRWVVLSRVWLPLTGKAPWSMIAFLDDAHRRGVLRQAGAVYQFRHARIQAQLAERFERRRRGAGNPADLATQPRAGG